LSLQLGLIEGFYGRAWTWAQRASLITALASHGYRAHLYAPKADATLRADWRQPLPPGWLADLDAHQSICAGCSVEFGVGLSPHGFDPQSTADWRRFDTLIAELNGLKLDSLALLFDDPADRRPLSPSIQAKLVGRAGAITRARHLFVCPTWYSNDPLLEQIYGVKPPDYLRHLGNALDPSVNVFWAGEQICATGFDAERLEKVAVDLGRLPTLWDNYPVNDGPQMFGHLHLRAPQQRCPAVLNGRIRAHFINPALQSCLTRIPAVALSALYRQGAIDRATIEESERFLSAAAATVSEALAHQLWRDLSTLQDAGLSSLGAMRSELLERYSVFSEPAAREVVLWLNGFWQQHDLKVDTQPD